MSKKGQAAMEYLVTYSWALLLLVIVTVAIISTGIFSPNQFIKEECSIHPDMGCSGAQIYNDGNTKLNFRITNNLGYDIFIKGIAFQVKGESAGEEDINKKMVQGGAEEIKKYDLGVELPLGMMQRVDVIITYYTCAPEVNPECATNSDFEHTMVGRIIGRVSEVQ